MIITCNQQPFDYFTRFRKYTPFEFILKLCIGNNDVAVL